MANNVLRFELDRGNGPQPWFWRVRTITNWRELARSSETYARREDAIHSAQLVIQWAETAEFVDVSRAA